MSDAPYRDFGRGRRKNRRREFHYLAKLLGPDTQWNAFIVDISSSGAQLEVLNPQELPDEFSLTIGGQAAVQRVCRIVWRSDARIGVRFVRQPERLPTAPNTSLRRQQSRKSGA